MKIEEFEHKIIKVFKTNEKKYVTVKEISKLINVNEKKYNRLIRRIIQNIVNNQKLLIGSCSKGFFIIETQDDYNVSINKLLKIRDGIDKRINNLETSWTVKRLMDL